ncbi:thiol-activated cytolysin family protein [Armatimonas sp.]|uniref:thiol-activated cytolysin family protein n=1 Tax=Armatimonas sp. TaxID=1872638 RepID=UPI0037522D62
MKQSLRTALTIGLDALLVPCALAQIKQGGLLGDQKLINVNTPPANLSPANQNLWLASSANDLLNRLPNWTLAGYSKPVRPDAKMALGSSAGSPTQVNRRTYNVTLKNYSLTETPEAIISFAPIADFWLGNLIQEKGMRSGLGSINVIPVAGTQRAPLTVYIASPQIPGASRTIANPTAASVTSAVGELLRQLQPNQIGTEQTFNYTYASSAEQSALELGVDFEFLGNRVKEVFNNRASANEESINGLLIVKGYTLAADIGRIAGGAAFFSSVFTVNDTRRLVADGYIGVDNLPCYISSVTYGTMIAFNMRRTFTEEEIKNRFDAHGSFLASLDVKQRSTQLRQDRQTRFSWAVVGGSSDGAYQAGRSYNDFDQAVRSLLSQRPTAIQMRPISYEVHSLKDRSRASMQRTTNYTDTQYAPNPLGEHYRITARVILKDTDDGTDSDLEVYGAMRLNDTILWERPESSPLQGQRLGAELRLDGSQFLPAHPRLAGPPEVQVLYAPGTLTPSGSPVTITGHLWDYDSISGNEDVGEYNISITPAELKRLVETNTERVYPNQHRRSSGDPAAIITLSYVFE